MNEDSGASTKRPSTIPPDDLQRNMAVARPNQDQHFRHIGLVGDTYTILLTGEDTAGRYCLIDMHIPRGGGPPPHRHDFEESFIMLAGELEATFRGVKSVVRAGETINIPSNAPHQFYNASNKPVRTPEDKQGTGHLLIQVGLIMLKIDCGGCPVILTIGVNGCRIAEATDIFC